MLDLISSSKDKDVLFIYEVCHKEHPYRPLDWRWQLVSIKNKLSILLGEEDTKELLSKAFANEEELLQNSENLLLNLPTLSNSITNKAFSSTTTARVINYLKNVPYEIRLAYYIYKSDDTSPDYPLLKASLESYLLTKLSYENIALKLQLPIKTVEFFEKMFFNVKDRLENTIWIINNCFGYDNVFSLSMSNYYKVWKIYAYFCGEDILEKIIKITYPASSIMFDGAELNEKAVLESELRNTLLFKLIILAKNINFESEKDYITLSNLIKVFSPSQHTVIAASTTTTNISVSGSLENYHVQSNGMTFQDNINKLADYIKSIPIEVSLPPSPDELAALPNIEENYQATIDNNGKNL
jgi:hypothetical protein